MTAWDYSVGKVCFGLFSRTLIDRVQQKTGGIFFPVTPDYTSMTLGLSLAESGVSTNFDGIVHIDTSISNGKLAASSASHLQRFLSSVDPDNTRYQYQLIMGVDCSLHNLVYADMARSLRLSGSSMSLNEKH